MEIREILKNITYWDTCPEDYKIKIKEYLTSTGGDDKTMKFKAKPVVKKIINVRNFPNGLYHGAWEGYIIKFKYKEHMYELETMEGVRGINIPVIIEVKEDIITFDDHKNPTDDS